MRRTQFSEIQFHGERGVTRPCIDAIVRLINFGDTIDKAALLSFGNKHCFLLTINGCDRVAIKSGFSSGYTGEGPHGLATALQLLERHGADVDEYCVTEAIVDAIDASALLREQLDEVDALEPRRPNRVHDYVFDVEGAKSKDYNHGRLNAEFPTTLPFALIDPRITDLALSFAGNPDASIMSAFRRLEDIVRQKAGLESERSARLFSKAFQSDTPMIIWKGIDPTEQKARASLFDAIYRAYRNPRAHRELPGDLVGAIREFLLLNELFLLEATAVRRPADDAEDHKSLALEKRDL